MNTTEKTKLKQKNICPKKKIKWFITLYCYFHSCENLEECSKAYINQMDLILQ